jgi:glycosidase
MYFALVDRFAPSEASPTLPVDRRDPAFWHGGDLSTLRRHLDDLQSLGAGAVWISPVSSCRESKIGPSGPSHCYWVEDPAVFERRFGTFEQLRALRDELHSRGMKLVLDVVLNDVAPDSPLLAKHPEWFHPPMALLDYSDPVQLEKGQIGGLPNLAQERPEVAKYLIDTTRDWVRRVEPDGLRLDAVKHIPSTFGAQLASTLHAEFPGLLLIGEDFDFDPLKLARLARTTGLDALLDFPLQGALLDALCRDLRISDHRERQDRTIVNARIGAS